MGPFPLINWAAVASLAAVANQDQVVQLRAPGGQQGMFKDVGHSGLEMMDVQQQVAQQGNMINQQNTMGKGGLMGME